MAQKIPNDDKLLESFRQLEHALDFEDKVSKDRFYFSGICKSFETCLEYAWKYFKRQATDQGLEVYSPKEAIKLAGQLGLIEDVESWLGFLNDRNVAVHDYLGIPDQVYLKTIKSFAIQMKTLISKINA